MSFGIYIHIPFCKQACSYCNFFFSTRRKYIPEFLSRLEEELIHSDWSLFGGQPETLYIGGGTPSLIPLQDMERLINRLRETMDLSALREVTLEVNPDDLTTEKLRAWRNMGIDRLSIGVQSFRDELLQFMHRAHDRSIALKALEKVQPAGFTNFSVDLIYGNPGQTTEMLQEDIEQLLAFDPPHISAYALTIEPRTRLGKLNELGRLQQADEERVIAHSDHLQEKLASGGYHRYEVSNYARPGLEAIHNGNYWIHTPYIGYGPGAHSFRWSPDGRSGIRTIRKPDLKSYLTEPRSHTTETEMLDLHTLAEERIMTGLRTRNGVDPKELENRYGYTFSQKQWQLIARFRQRNWISSTELLQLTDEGWHIADRITLELLSAM